MEINLAQCAHHYAYGISAKVLKEIVYLLGTGSAWERGNMAYDLKKAIDKARKGGEK